jgi:hypothetical protein
VPTVGGVPTVGVMPTVGGVPTVGVMLTVGGVPTSRLVPQYRESLSPSAVLIAGFLLLILEHDPLQ